MKCKMPLTCREFSSNTDSLGQQPPWGWGSDKDDYQGVLRKIEIGPAMPEDGQPVRKLMNGGGGVR